MTVAISKSLSMLDYFIQLCFDSIKFRLWFEQNKTGEFRCVVRNFPFWLIFECCVGRSLVWLTEAEASPDEFAYCAFPLPLVNYPDIETNACNRITDVGTQLFIQLALKPMKTQIVWRSFNKWFPFAQSHQIPTQLQFNCIAERIEHFWNLINFVQQIIEC